MTDNPKCRSITTNFTQSEYDKWVKLAEKKGKTKGPMLYDVAVKYMEENGFKARKPTADAS